MNSTLTRAGNSVAVSIWGPMSRIRRSDTRFRVCSPAGPAGDWTLHHLLPAPDRFVLLLLYGEGWSVAEIAEKTGWSRSKVKVRAYRARKKLRRRLEEGVAA